jgi:tetratricopeptide (TPR) repeat protein
MSHDRRNDASAGTLETEGDTRRREFLTLLATMAGSSLSGIDLERLAPPEADSRWLEGAESVSAALAAEGQHIEASSLLPAFLGHLRSLESGLPATGELTARTTVVTGIALSNAGRRAVAYRAYALAIALGSDPVKAKALNGQARVHEVRDDRPAALAHQDEAIRLASGAPRLRAGLLARRAELHAVGSDDLAALRDLEAAQRDMTGTFEWFYDVPENDVELGAYRGCVLATLGRHREATEAFEWVLARMDPSKVLWRARVAADRDAVLMQLS